MNTKHIHEAQVGDKITACGNVTFTDTFHVKSIAKMMNGKPYLIKGDGGKAIVTGNGDERTLTLA